MTEFKKIIKNELSFFDKKFNIVLSTKAKLLHRVSNYLTNNSGKKIRPICTIISSGLANSITEKTYRGAILIELIHTATLIHDDIVDDAYIRRKSFTLNGIWKNKISVLSGDYFLAKGLKLAVEKKDYDILHLISEVVEKMVEGELIQLEKTKKLNLIEEDYFKIIKLKTASLFEASFRIGALAANIDGQTANKLQQLGLNIGILFQIKDDILDYKPSKKTGKTLGNDIKEGKINLPLLYAFKKMTKKEKNMVYRILRKKFNTLDEIQQVQHIVAKYSGVEYAKELIKKYYNGAMKIISTFSNTKYKEALILMLNFLINRDK